MNKTTLKRTSEKAHTERRLEQGVSDERSSDGGRCPDLDVISDPVLVVDSGLRIIHANVAATARYGEIAGKSYDEVFTHWDRESERAIIREAFKTGQMQKCEVETRDPRDHGRLFLAVSASPAHETPDQPRRVVVVHRDTTAHVQMEQSLHRRITDLQCLYQVSRLKDQRGITLKEFFQHTVDLIPPALTHADIAGVKIHYGDEEYRSNSFVETPWKQVADILADSANLGVVEICYINERPLDDTAEASGDRALIDTLARELGKYAERLHTTEALRNSERLFADMVNFLPDPTFAINMDKMVIAWNHAMERLTGTSAADMLGKSDFEYSLPFYRVRRPIMVDLVLTGDPKIEAMYPHIRRDGPTLTTELFIPTVKPGGSYFWIKATPLYDSQGKVVGAIETTRDLTDHKQMEDSLLTAKKQLEDEREALRNKNTALREMLDQIDQEKQRIMQQTQANVDKLVMPLVRSVIDKAPPDLAPHISLLHDCLEEIAAPFVNSLETRFGSLSPRELQICNMIRVGMSCKDIAATLDTSVYTVLNQRQRIRQKLGISNSDKNLASFLQTVHGGRSR
jgi:PAS domain S-box-containing protein